MGDFVLFHSLISYGIILGGSSALLHNAFLNKKRFARIVLGLGHRSHVERLVKTRYTHCTKFVHSCQQKSIGLKFSKSQTGSDVWHSCHHNLSRFTFPIFAHSCRISVLHSLQSITPCIYRVTDGNRTFFK